MVKKVTERMKARKIITKLGLSKRSSNFFVSSLEYCLKNNISPADVILTRDFYPINMDNYEVTRGEVEMECRRSIKDAWIDHPEKFITNLEYNGNRKLTIKKIMVLCLIELYK